MRKVFVALVTVCLAALACGSTQHDLKGGKAPDWANRAPGGWKCTLEGQTGFCSLGMVTGIKGDNAMRRTAAAERARVGLQRLVDTYSAALLKSYQAATTEFKDAAEEQHVETAIKTFTAGHLSGVEIRDYWENEGHDAFGLAFLSLADYKAGIEKTGNLTTKTREIIRANADKVHQDLKDEETKREVQ